MKDNGVTYDPALWFETFFDFYVQHVPNRIYPEEIIF